MFAKDQEGNQDQVIEPGSGSGELELEESLKILAFLGVIGAEPLTSPRDNAPLGLLLLAAWLSWFFGDLETCLAHVNYFPYPSLPHLFLFYFLSLSCFAFSPVHLVNRYFSGGMDSVVVLRDPRLLPVTLVQGLDCQMVMVFCSDLMLCCSDLFSQMQSKYFIH